jgi:hypothetical protein
MAYPVGVTDKHHPADMGWASADQEQASDQEA